MTDDELDAWLASPAIRARHRRSARAEAADLWRAAGEVRLDQTRTVGRLVQWRLPGTPMSGSFAQLLATHPFAVLDEGDGWSVSGMCGRIWTTALDYPRIDAPQQFLDWDERGTVRVLFAHWVASCGPGASSLFSEARVAPVDRRAQFALRSLWLVVGRFERLIGAEPLALAVRRAEKR